MFQEMGYDLSEYVNLKKWFESLHVLPGFDENRAGAKASADRVRSVYSNSIC